VSFSAGALFGDAFIHLVPQAMAPTGVPQYASAFILLGIVSSFMLERFLQWRHCHIPTSEDHPHLIASMNLYGDAVHNLIDGLVMGGSYIISTPLGIATTLAVILHEIPQEIGDFGVLIYGGFGRTKALLMNFLTALTAVLGTILALSLGVFAQDFIPFLIPFAAGNFIYIAGSDLIPELRKDQPVALKSGLQLLALVLGISLMFSLVLLE
jgi:zinc and cadmium transporter